MSRTIKETGSEKYKYVVKSVQNGKTKWRVTMKGVSRISYDTEREAALVVDKYMISKGKSPLNILKKMK